MYPAKTKALFSFQLQILAVLLILFSFQAAYPQGGSSTGVLEVTGRVKIGSKQEMITRKRFYLLRGGLDSNKALIEKLRAVEAVSRECFYCKLHASLAYLAWLRDGDCESAYCRQITGEDITKVPEFKSAYEKTLLQYGNKPALAQKWLTNNLSSDLRNGFYNKQKSLLSRFLEGVKPVQSAMMESVNSKAQFIEIPLGETVGKTTETFLVSNLIPIEIGDKSYVWACEVAIGSEKTVTLKLQVPESGKVIRKCEVIVKYLPVCTAGSCAKG